VIAVAFSYTEAEGLLKQWEYVLSHFRVDALYCVGTTAPPRGFVLGAATCVQTGAELPQDMSLVLLAPLTGRIVQGTTSLVNFTHPENACYWFGDDDGNFDPDELYGGRQPDHIVYVPTDTADQMYSHVTWAVVAWDRQRKGG